jgi:hypothetical protein
LLGRLRRATLCEGRDARTCGRPVHAVSAWWPSRQPGNRVQVSQSTEGTWRSRLNLALTTWRSQLNLALTTQPGAHNLALTTFGRASCAHREILCPSSRTPRAGTLCRLAVPVVSFGGGGGVGRRQMKGCAPLQCSSCHPRSFFASSTQSSWAKLRSSLGSDAHALLHGALYLQPGRWRVRGGTAGPSAGTNLATSVEWHCCPHAQEGRASFGSMRCQCEGGVQS